MSIRFNLKRPSGKKSRVRAIVRIEGKRYSISTNVTVTVSDWDKKREKCKTDHQANKELETARQYIEDEIKKNGKPPIAEPDRPKSKKKKQKAKLLGPTIIQAIQDHLRRKELESTTPNTWRTYQTLESCITRFTDQKKRKEKYLTDLTPEYIEQFQKWMIECEYTNGHIAKMVKMLRTVIRKLVPAEVWNQTKPPQAKPADQIYLTPAEIHAIENLDIPADNFLHRIRDMFLIGCYTGLRFSDWKQVGRSRIQTVNGIEILTISQTKTKNPTTLPVTTKLKAIIDRYPDGIPGITSQGINRSIKKLGRMAGLTQIITITEYRAGRPNLLHLPKWELMSTHTARRSFATNALLAGIPMTEVMKFTGHKNITAFMQYIRTTNQDAAINYANHPFFNQ